MAAEPETYFVCPWCWHKAESHALWPQKGQCTFRDTTWHIEHDEDGNHHKKMEVIYCTCSWQQGRPGLWRRIFHQLGGRS